MRRLVKLILFDIDGTMLYSNGNGKLALIKAVEEVYKRTINSSIRMAGKTDKQIVYELLKDSLSKEEIYKSYPLLFSSYIRYLKSYYTIDRGVGIYSGVRELLDAIKRVNGNAIGLLTGNIYKGAVIKLSTFNIKGYFSFGAFGDDGFYRYELPGIAVKRALDKTKHRFTGKDIVIIGDTTNDIECGRHLGVKTIVVCTNKNSERSLKQAKPDYFFHSFECTDDVIEAIFR